VTSRLDAASVTQAIWDPPAIFVNALMGRVTTSCLPPSAAARADASPSGMGRIPYANVLKTSTAMTAQKETAQIRHEGILATTVAHATALLGSVSVILTTMAQAAQ